MTVQDRWTRGGKGAADVVSSRSPVRTGVGPRQQFCALPYREGDTLQILLITSRESRRWVAPKGWPMPGRTHYRTAQREALEEAGVRGDIAKTPLGTYGYYKRLKNGTFVPVRVEVYPMRVKEERKSWPEKKQRERRWFTPEEAAAAVVEPELRALILAFAAMERR